MKYKISFKSIILVSSFILSITTQLYSQNTSETQGFLKTIDSTINVENKVQLYVDLAWEFILKENDSALIYAQHAYEFSETNNYHLGKAIALETNGLYYEIVDGNYDLASKYYFEGIDLCEVHKLPYIASLYHSLGVMFHTSDDYKKAKKYYNIAYEKALITEDLVLQKKCLINLGSINSSQANFKMAEELMLKSLEINLREELNYSTYANLGNLKIRQEKYQEAIPFLIQATEQHPDNIDSEENLMYLINAKVALNDSIGLKAIIKRAIIHKDQTNALRLKSNMAMSLSNYYKQFGDYKTALKYHTDYLDMYEEIREKQRDQTVYDLETKYQTEKNEQEILALKQQQDLLKEKQRFKILITYAIIATFGILFLVLWVRIVKRRVLHQKQLEIKDQENEITQLKLVSVENENKHYTNELNQFMQLMMSKNTQIKKLQHQLDDFPAHKEQEAQFKEKINQLHNTTILTDEDWKAFKILFEQTHPSFIKNIINYNNSMSSGDLRLATLLKLNLSNPEIGSILGISSESVRKNKYRFRIKLQFDTDKKLQDFISNL